jgi:putative NADH-flavin reductase
MRVAVLGPTGFSGSNISVELLNRGHEVIGISRRPEKLGKNEKYQTRALDISTATIAQLIDTLNGAEVLVNCYNGARDYSEYSNLQTT